MGKERLDVALVLRRLFFSREKAIEVIKRGIVYVNSKQIIKPSFQVEDDDVIDIVGKRLSYVSKGGLKLEKGIKKFGLDFMDKTVLDVGCSTGGFADCALQHGAAFVYGIDVGINQLGWSLRKNRQLKYIENLHVRDLQSEHLDDKQMDAIVVDVSFISVTKVFSHLLPFLKQEGFIFVLIKPQFELTRSYLGKNGIVKRQKHQITAVEQVIVAAKKFGLHLQQIDYAPLMTYKKNIEYIALFSYLENDNLFNINLLIENTKAEKEKMKKEKCTTRDE